MASRADSRDNLNTTATILLVGLTINQNEEEITQEFVIDARLAFVPLWAGCQRDITCQADAQGTPVAIYRCVYCCAEVTR